jgi:hypothetical protein
MNYEAYPETEALVTPTAFVRTVKSSNFGVHGNFEPFFFSFNGIGIIKTSPTQK